MSYYLQETDIPDCTRMMLFFTKFISHKRFSDWPHLFRDIAVCHVIFEKLIFPIAHTWYYVSENPYHVCISIYKKKKGCTVTTRPSAVSPPATPTSPATSRATYSPPSMACVSIPTRKVTFLFLYQISLSFDIPYNSLFYVAYNHLFIFHFYILFLVLY